MDCFHRQQTTSGAKNRLDGNLWPESGRITDTTYYGTVSIISRVAGGMVGGGGWVAGVAIGIPCKDEPG